MLYALLALNIVVWLAVVAYSLRLVPPLRRAWRPLVAGALLAAAAALSLGSYRLAERQQAREAVARHYFAGIDERRRGNLDEAERQFREALSLKPGDPQARRQIEELEQQRSAERREQRREARVDPAAAPAPAPSQAPQPAPAAKPAPPAPPAPAAPPSRGQAAAKPKPPPHQPSPFEITHYALDVELDPAAHSLSAVATVRVRSRGGSVPRLELSLNPEFKPTAVQVDGAPARFRHTHELLVLEPARPLGPGQEATLTIRYRRRGGPLVQGGDLLAEQGSYLRSESRWYPATGELDFRAPVRVRARVPAGYSVVSVGGLRSVEKDGRTTLFHWETDRPAAMVSLAAARYVQQSVTLAPLPGVNPARAPLKLTCYTFPAHRQRAKLFLEEAAAIVRFYERRYGAYPYEKLAVVEIPFFPGGYGTTSFVMLIDKSFAARRLDREFLAHEIAHQWWGNSVFPQGLGAAWLTEAFANYSAWQYAAARAGNQRVLSRRVARATTGYFAGVARKGDQAIAEADPYAKVGAAEAIIYEKGAVVLHMLRRQVGDAAFQRALRAFADEFRFGKAKIPDFQRVAERESGQELGWFFEQWLGREGGIALAYSFSTEPASATSNEAVLRVTQAGAPFRAKLKVVLDVENSVQTHEIELSAAEQTFRFPVRGKLTNVLFDPDNDYLMQLPRWVVVRTGAGAR